MTDILRTYAEQYVKLVLKTGQIDPDFVDAFHGEPAWQKEAEQERPRITLNNLIMLSEELIGGLKAMNISMLTPVQEKRRRFLLKQLRACRARLDFLNGHPLSFDEESLHWFDAMAPSYGVEHFRNLLAKLDAVLSGSGEVSQRLNDYRNQFVIPKEHLDRVFKAAIAEGRARTLKYLSLPEEERFSIEYVTNKPWSGYNWYKGGACSLIQLNTDLPIYIDRAVDLACHEGYPGHHVYNTLIEWRLVRENGFVEFSVFPLFSPMSLLAEGTANMGIEIAFPAAERIQFEREVLFPLSGLDPASAEEYYHIHNLTLELAYAGNEAARNYLDHRITREEAVEWLVRFGLYSRERAEQRTRFFDKYRSYVINYNLGQDLVRKYLEKRGGTPENPSKRWAVFQELLTTPLTPSDLKN